MEVAATLTTAYKLTMCHGNTFSGQNDSSDDWELTAIGISYEDCINQIIPQYIEKLFSGDACGYHRDFYHISFVQIRSLVCNGEIYYSKNELNYPPYSSYKIQDHFNIIISNDLYKKLKKEKQEELVKKQEEQDKADEDLVRANELSLLKSLKEKYEINT